MKRILTLTLFTLAALSANAQDIAGDWQGSLKANGAELRLVLHITKAAGGSFTGTLDSIDQGAMAIPVSSVTLKGPQLGLGVVAVHASYSGKVNADASAISGTWTQVGSLPLEFKRQTAPIKTEHKPTKPSDIDGAWAGTLDTGAGKLRLVVHITNTEDGLVATMDSLDQGANGIPVTAVTRNGSALKLDVKGIGGAYDGQLDKSLSTLEGTWTQGGRRGPWCLRKASPSETCGAPLEPGALFFLRLPDLPQHLP